MKSQHKSRNEPQLATCVAPEDLNCGDYVAVLTVVHEFPSFLWCCDASSLQPHEPVQIPLRPSNSGTPLKIKAICLPFVFVKTPTGKSQTMDVRQTRFARLSVDYATAVWKDLKASQSKIRP